MTERLTEGALETLLRGNGGWRCVVREMAERAPDATPPQMIFALTSAAATIEETFAPGSPSRAPADAAMRLAALIGADLYAMEALGLPRGTAADLLAYWRAYDPWFLTL